MNLFFRDGNQVIETVPELQSLCLGDQELLEKLCNGILSPAEMEDVS